jgi:hypothetical protein
VKNTAVDEILHFVTQIFLYLHFDVDKISFKKSNIMQMRVTDFSENCCRRDARTMKTCDSRNWRKTSSSASIVSRVSQFVISYVFKAKDEQKELMS